MSYNADLMEALEPAESPEDEMALKNYSELGQDIDF